nr:unnamed protein product [Callosobruchus analis]
MPSTAWTNELVVELIHNYKLHECLWNAKHIKCKCRNTKHDAWVTLAGKIGKNVAEVKRKVKNILTQFARERRRRTMKKSGAAAYFKSKWFAYESLLFLSDKNKIRKCIEKGLAESKSSLFWRLGFTQHLCFLFRRFLVDNTMHVAAAKAISSSVSKFNYKR